MGFGEVRQSEMEFAALARRYCESIAKADQVDESVFFQEIATTLAELYFRAAHLRGTQEAYEVAESITGAWQAEYKVKLAKYLANHDFYWSIPDPYSSPYVDIAPDMGSLVDDLDDIAADLAHGLWLSEQGVPMQAVAWEWQITFRTHWGTHLVQALNVIHALLYRK